MSSMDILTGRKIIWIYSSNVFFIQGVKELVADVFGKKQYVIHVYDEKHILNITSVNDVSELRITVKEIGE